MAYASRYPFVWSCRVILVPNLCLSLRKRGCWADHSKMSHTPAFVIHKRPATELI
jgi:hypothetical protein